MEQMNRREFLKMTTAATGATFFANDCLAKTTNKPNVLFIMTDQQRFDTIAALGNQDIYTPNLDRLVRRGVSFVNAYTTCPECAPARYTIRTGCEPPRTLVFANGVFLKPAPGQGKPLKVVVGIF